jgi:hypothetical protein
MCALKVMKTPAEPARDPLGETYTITGISEFRISLVTNLMDSSNPPGVLSSITKTSELSLMEDSMAFKMMREEIGPITPSMVTKSICRCGAKRRLTQESKKRTTKIKTLLW